MNHQFVKQVLLILCCTGLSCSIQSEVTLDGSVGPSGTLTGPDYQITENLGKRADSNLFHSFGRFNLNASESATFSGSSGIKNVISRVTGGQASTIDGTLRVSIPNANLYLLNPAGVLFGEHAKLDVPGSFHVSTADYLKFQDGVRFDSGTATPPKILATAAPEAFGFLGENPAGISLSGNTHSVLNVKQGSNLSLIGGDIAIEETALVAPGGQVNLASVGSSGEVIVTESGLDTTSFNKMGDIHMSHDLLGPAAIFSKKVFVRGGQLVIDESVIRTESGDGSGIDVGLTGNLSILGFQNNQDLSSFNPGGLYTTAFYEEDAGNIVLKVAELKLVQGAIISTDTLSAGNGGDLAIRANTVSLSGEGTRISSILGKQSQGDGGNLTINVEDKFEIFSGALVSSNNIGTGKGGNVKIQANNILLSGDGVGTGISNEVVGQGDGGNLTINVEDKFEILNGAQISSSNGGTGKSGNMAITANTISLSGGDGKTAISSIVKGQGDGGNLTINVEDTFEILNGAHVNFGNSGTGKSGNMGINAGSILISAKINPEITGIYMIVRNTGSPGDLSINAKSLKILNGGLIHTTTGGAAEGGNVNIKSESIVLSGNGKGNDTGILGGTISETTGDAGKLSIKATKSLDVNNGAIIATSTTGNARGGNLLIEGGNIKISDGKIRNRAELNSTGNAGNFTIKANNLVMSGGEITNSAEKDSTGNAGTLDIEVTDKVELKDNALISTSTSGAGQGGSLILKAKDILLDDARLEATSESRNIDVYHDSNIEKAGNIEITPTSTFRVKNGSSINVGTEAANAGDIRINNGKVLQLNDSEISTSVRDGEGNGGNIFISTPIVILDSSNIIARAAEGKGGNINISGFLFQSPSSIVSTSSELGIDGNIDLKPDTNISGSLAVLPDTFLNASQQMNDRCVARSGNNLSSFVVKGRGGTPPTPGNLTPSNFLDYVHTVDSSLQDKSSEIVAHHSLGKSKSSSPLGLDCTQ